MKYDQRIKFSQESEWVPARITVESTFASTSGAGQTVIAERVTCTVEGQHTFGDDDIQAEWENGGIYWIRAKTTYTRWRGNRPISTSFELFKT